MDSQFDGSSALIWADGTDGSSVPSPSEIMSHVTAGFSPEKLKSVKQVATPADIPLACPQNFNLFSECFAAVAFNDIPANGSSQKPINYTIRADAGLFFIDVVNHNSDFERRILPLQWALDQVSAVMVSFCGGIANTTQAIIELKTGAQIPTPLEWPYTKETNEEQARDTRLSTFQRPVHTFSNRSTTRLHPRTTYPPCSSIVSNSSPSVGVVVSRDLQIHLFCRDIIPTARLRRR